MCWHFVQKNNYKKQYTGQERKTFQKYPGSNKTAPYSKFWFQEPPERKSLLIQILKVVYNDDNNIGSRWVYDHDQERNHQYQKFGYSLTVEQNFRNEKSVAFAIFFHVAGDHNQVVWSRP